MKVIVVIDDKNGLLFNHRRQSQDRIIREKILSIIQGRKLWMNAYSHRQFKDEPVSGRIAEAEEIRHASDYDDFYIATEDEAKEQIATALELIGEIEEYIKGKI